MHDMAKDEACLLHDIREVIHRVPCWALGEEGMADHR